MYWNLSEAKSRLGEVLDRAGKEGPQRIRRRKEAFVVLPETDYEKLTGRAPSFKDWIMNGPGFEGVMVRRDRSPIRNIKLTLGRISP